MECILSQGGGGEESCRQSESGEHIEWWVLKVSDGF